MSLEIAEWRPRGVSCGRPLAECRTQAGDERRVAARIAGGQVPSIEPHVGSVWRLRDSVDDKSIDWQVREVEGRRVDPVHCLEATRLEQPRTVRIVARTLRRSPTQERFFTDGTFWATRVGCSCG